MRLYQGEENKKVSTIKWSAAYDNIYLRTFTVNPEEKKEENKYEFSHGEN